jgi:Cof subfamily protein (haloacid dehalogenase superfamily)
MKILASDFDGTLFFHTGFKEKDLLAIKDFQRQGHKFGICTGRSLDGVLIPSDNVDIHYDFYIVNSGGMILDENQNVIFESKIPFSIIKEIYEKFPIAVSVVDGNMMYLMFNWKKRYQVRLRRLLQKLQGIPNETSPFIKDLSSLTKDSYNGFSFHFPNGKEQDARECANYINKHYGAYCHAFTNKVHVDICAKGCSKGAGVKFIEEYFQSDVIGGIGDSWNDLPMINNVDESFTFPYAPDDVQEQSDHIVKHLDEAISYLISE